MKITAKKSLGQNWLNSPSAINKIVTAGEIKPTDTILEIGPGRGALTKALLATGAKVVAIEKDHQLISDLENTFEPELKNGQLQLLEGDILQASELLSLKNIAQADRAEHSNFPAGKYAHSENLIASSYKVIANIPYYITGELLRLFFETTNQPSLMVLMVQKEVAERIVARDGKESILSISVKVYGTPKIIATVPAGAFIPKPNVDSAILAITNINHQAFPNTQTEVDFFAIVKQGFAQKRKLVKNNINCSEEIMTKCNLNIKARAETLTVSDWLCLTKNLKHNDH
ncbi:MAG: 16S rRNA (adenine(1518)-N(6)/adenine(1519)-N(6))-dimethyltransferase RsmA [Candidatus Vogelbacteria bacterium]|nr:16S rRNA (adenine(1518)-N(6)/adenine(1519)-N(6))-dimethyltransferase RsmA [Candidatus Vogelbacteria bacterium]